MHSAEGWVYGRDQVSLSECSVVVILYVSNNIGCFKFEF